MAQFAALLDTAIANADSRALLSASRVRLLTASDDARRRVVRDLHDGAQLARASDAHPMHERVAGHRNHRERSSQRAGRAAIAGTHTGRSGWPSQGDRSAR